LSEFLARINPDYADRAKNIRDSICLDPLSSASNGFSLMGRSKNSRHVEETAAQARRSSG
jgi:hypothetical protein